jgi:hypothetical protein
VVESVEWVPLAGAPVTGSYIAFGVDHDGEILLLTADRVYRLGPG